MTTKRGAHTRGAGRANRTATAHDQNDTHTTTRIGDFKYRFTDQPSGWFGNTTKVDWPIVTNLRLDPYERTGLTVNAQTGSVSYLNWYMYEFWRGVFVQEETEKLGQTFVDFPPAQKGASFNLASVKEQVAKAMAARGNRGD